ncbi:2'-5' RNA ligase [Acidilobus saccharovorans 345-15]|uniref:RNA 2',3'-cyclic phosphodiesterase n=1 Tax=Acidilobus saccharovorans (strain DSM 16705 / JCM 18335 / VKM B-2471 / 345-15) TaxID=666510 RepID=D9Q2J2_ACIS3|nr:2'-5' RNA ligase [Acidilobus saccharovorans 345-15]
MRAFIAVDIDRPELVSKLKELEQELESTRVRMKLVEPENFHITLRFLGEIPDSAVSDIRSGVLPKLRFKPFTLKLSGVGAFPSPNLARVIWVGIVQGFDELKSIRDQLDKLLKDTGIKYESGEEFTPHITIARLKERSNPEVAKFVLEHSSYEVGEMVVNAVRLKKSILTPRGPIYETIAEAHVE